MMQGWFKVDTSHLILLVKNVYRKEDFNDTEEQDGSEKQLTWIHD